MKYVIIIPDGAADLPMETLGNRTPLQAARLPHTQKLARQGITGQSLYVPEGMPPGSDVASLGLFGYNPSLYYSGRAPLEAAAQKIVLGDHDWAVRCNLVTIEQGKMVSFTAGQISSEEAAEIIQTMNEELSGCFAGSPCIEFHAGVGYRHLLIVRRSGEAFFNQESKTCPPHDYTDQPVEQALPDGPGSPFLRELMNESRKILAEHAVNKKRKREGKLPATQIWLWGQGQRTSVPLLRFQNGQRKKPPQNGAMITAVDLLRGIAESIGLTNICVPGATAYFDTDYAAKARYAVEALKEFDLVCIHIEAPDEAGHEGNAEEKIRALEQIDEKIVAPVADALRSYGEWTLFYSPDHPTPCALKTHTRGHVPWFVSGSSVPAQDRLYDEQSASESGRSFDCGWELLPSIWQPPEFFG
ncbi:MAG: cofactor-independent phosphoglycerate mutase [Planctomycetaceae bacterium]|nr:cofactor-independent phosphoglycerate mutase [Planctomycetaceae bacterium]